MGFGRLAEIALVFCSEIPNKLRQYNEMASKKKYSFIDLFPVCGSLSGGYLHTNQFFGLKYID